MESKNMKKCLVFNKNEKTIKEMDLLDENVEVSVEKIDDMLDELDSLILKYIKNIEEKLNYKFPSEYEKFLLQYNLSTFSKKLFALKNGDEKTISRFYSIDIDKPECILNFQNFDSKLKNKLVAVAELDDGDVLCFDCKTNKITLYNKEKQTNMVIYDNCKEFLEDLYDDYVYKASDGFEYKYRGFKVIVTSDEPTDEILNYGNDLVDFYINNKSKVDIFLINDLKKIDHINDMDTEKQIIDLIGKPSFYINTCDSALISYLDSKLDEHLISIEIHKFKLCRICVEG